MTVLPILLRRSLHSCIHALACRRFSAHVSTVAVVPVSAVRMRLRALCRSLIDAARRGEARRGEARRGEARRSKKSRFRWIDRSLPPLAWNCNYFQEQSVFGTLGSRERSLQCTS